MGPYRVQVTQESPRGRWEQRLLPGGFSDPEEAIGEARTWLRVSAKVRVFFDDPETERRNTVWSEAGTAT